MMDLAILQRQHKEVRELIESIKEMIYNNRIDEDALNLAAKINMLAGKLKVHLATEDKYMYPHLLQSDNERVRKTALAYADEMGHINQAFMDYKDKFNTRTKIVSNIQEFSKETRHIFQVLEERMSKEDLSLYIYVA